MWIAGSAFSWYDVLIIIAVIIAELEGLPNLPNFRHSRLLSQCVHFIEYSFTSFILPRIPQTITVPEIRTTGGTTPIVTHCATSVATLLWTKTPEFTLKKKQTIIKKNRHPKCLKKSKPDLKCILPVLAHKIKVICIICIIFLTSSSLFLNILTIYK